MKLFLAGGTVERAAAALLNACNGGAAPGTGIAFFAVNEQVVLKFPFLTEEIAPVRDGCSPAGNSLFKDAWHNLCDGFPFFARQGRGFFLRIDLGAMENFASVDIADSGKGFLIEEKSFD